MTDSKATSAQASSSQPPSAEASSSIEYEDHRNTTPPPYSSSTLHIPEPTSPSIIRYPGLPQLDYSQYCPPNFKAHSTSWLPTEDDGAIITSHELYSRSPEALKRLIKTQASLPPKPVIRITGNRGGRTDFDLKLNLMSYYMRTDQEWNYLEIVLEDDGAGKKKKRKGRGLPEPVDWLDDIAKRFCKDSVGTRQLVITRKTTNYDFESIEGRIRSLISRLNYPGQVSIRYSLLHSKVTIQPPQKAFASLSNLFRSTKKYEVNAVWPYADVGPGVAGLGGGGGGSGVQRRFAVQSEEDWWRDWREAVSGAVLGRRKGWVSGEDRLEVLMGLRKGEEGGGVWSERGDI